LDERISCVNAAPDGPVYTVPEVAALLRVHKSTVYRDVESGRIDAYRVGKGRGTVRITADALREYRRRAVTRPAEDGSAGHGPCADTSADQLKEKACA
jgi:excisionase family DNA binding protein